jgi:predicted O-methyltransferase YrrM
MLHFGLWCLGIERADTQTTESERDCLARHADQKRRLAEIGVWHGVTTCRLRRAMHPAAVLVAVDPYPVGRLGFSTQQIIAHREVSKIRHGTVQWLRKTGIEAAQSQTPESFDFVFIDGDHSYDGLKRDWEAWSGLIAPGGVIGLHDSRSTPDRQIEDAGSVRYTREVISLDPRFQIIDTVDSLTVLRRR